MAGAVPGSIGRRYSVATIIALVAAGVMLAAVGGASAAGARAARACGTIRINYRPTASEHYTRMYISTARSVSCATARRVMRRYRNDRGPCSGSSCFRFYPDGWTCDAVTPGDWPVIQECYRRSPRIRVVGRVHSTIPGPR